MKIKVFLLPNGETSLDFTGEGFHHCDNHITIFVTTENVERGRFGKEHKYKQYHNVGMVPMKLVHHVETEDN